VIFKEPEFNRFWPTIPGNETMIVPSVFSDVIFRLQVYNKTNILNFMHY